MRIEVQEPVFIKANTGMICGGVNPRNIRRLRKFSRKLIGIETMWKNCTESWRNTRRFRPSGLVPKKHLEVSYGEPFKRDGIQGPGSFHGAIAL
ncbi:hypothetical protein BV898_15235 [Hypsibius exemplaris]|uniref:Uncharacterized protein n=1 Tax=Hypsibius exemplaris TaxID=2072580 RepID=A0A9X6NCL3_HYPEX|nr:hypothetical protein BV898_15235 [Hypsibius exemplaris]